MPYTMEEFVRETLEELIRKQPLEKRLEGLTPEERVKGLTPETLEALARELRAKEPSSKPG